MPVFDLAIIGAGPGGLDAGLRARELGLKVALLEKSEPGGTCLNTGCIPTKALLASTKLLTKLKAAKSFGLSAVSVSADRAGLVERKTQILETLRKGMTESLKRSGVEWIQGEASFVSKDRLRVGSREIAAKTILLATGSEPVSLPGVTLDGEKIVSSSHLLELKSIPGALVVIGGGVVGVEFASIFQPLGTKVTIVEMLPQLLPGEDEEIARRLESIFRRKGIEALTGERVQKVSTKGGVVETALESGQRLESDQVLMAVGRKPRLDSLGLDRAAVKTEKGAVVVNEYLETSTAGIFAIGDVTNRTTGLAHAASAEGIRVVENLKGPRRKMEYGAVPRCIYSDPEVASVGRSGAGVEAKILFASLGKPHVEGETEGFVKMTASKPDGRILGVTGIGARMTEIIGEAALAVRLGVSVRDLAETIHAHPTESEILQKAAEALVRMLR